VARRSKLRRLSIDRYIGVTRQLGRVLINAQIAAPLLWAIHIGCPKNDAQQAIDEGPLYKPRWWRLRRFVGRRARMKGETQRGRRHRHATKALWRLCMPRAIAVAFGAALTLRVVLGAVPANATTFPVVAPGDPVSGIFTLDPSTPLTVLIPNQIFQWVDPGSIALAIGGRIFAAQISYVANFLPPYSLSPFWQIITDHGTVNGEAVPLLVMNFALANPTGSISLFPPPLTEAPPNQNLNLLQMAASTCRAPRSRSRVKVLFMTLTSRRWFRSTPQGISVSAELCPAFPAPSPAQDCRV
jgi:hypothetical protein